MYKNLLIIICLLCLLSCKDNRKEYYPTGELKAEYQVKNDQLHGTVKEYFKNGELKVETFYENGMLEGIKKVYYENGQLDWEANYKDDKENGIFKDYSEEGVLLSKSYYKNGLQDGLTIVYFPNGNIKSKSMFKKGFVDGEFKEFYNNGNLSMVAENKNDKPVFYKKYTKEGDLKEEYRLISIEFENDSIYIGEQCKAKIKIYGPLLETVRATIQLADSNLSRVPLKDEINIKENNYVFIEILNNTGHFVLNLRVFIENDIYFHTADLYVLEKPEN